MAINKSKRKGSESKFPGKLHDMMKYVEQQGLEHVISCVLNGRGFMIHDPDRIVDILPLFFGQTKYRSFRRQLNMWHFDRVKEGPNKGAFLHPYFVRGNRELCSQMSRQLIGLAPSTFGSQLQSKSQKEAIGANAIPECSISGLEPFKSLTNTILSPKTLDRSSTLMTMIQNFQNDVDFDTDFFKSPTSTSFIDSSLFDVGMPTQTQDAFAGRTFFLVDECC